MKDLEPQLKTSDGTGQRYGAMFCGMLGLCGPESREQALTEHAHRHLESTTGPSADGDRPPDA